MAAVGAQSDHVVGGLLVFISDGVGADAFELGLQATVDRVVVSGELDHRFLPWVQEGDVLRADLGFYQQGVVQRHDFDHVAARLDHTANGVDQQLLDDPAHGRGDQGAADPVFQRAAGGLGLVQFSTGFVELGQGFAAEFAAGFIDLALHFLDRRFSTRDRQGGGVQLPAGFHFGALEAQHFYRRHRALGHQRLGHVDFLALQGQLAAVLALLGGELAQFLLALHELFLQAADFVFQLLAAAFIQGALVGGLARRGLEHLVRDVQRAVIHLGAQTLDTQLHGQAQGFGFPGVGDKPRVVETNQRRASLYDLAFLDVQLGDDAAFKVLDFLQLGRRNRLAVATGHFVDLGETGPHHQKYKERDDCPDGQADDPWRIFDQRLVDLGQRLALQRIGAFEVAADRTLDGVKQH